jgi:hypothetical protein
MKLPYVIDNQSHRLTDILSGLLDEHKGRSLDVATAYFTTGGFGLVKDGLLRLPQTSFFRGDQQVCTGRFPQLKALP